MFEFFGLIFLDYHYFWLLLLIIVYFVASFSQRKYGIYFSLMDDLKLIYKRNSFFLYFQKFLVILLIFFYAIILANPNTLIREKRELKEGIDIVFTLDLSWSMLADDLKPDRLESAKEVIENFVKNLETDRVGMVLFAGKAFTYLPLSEDYESVLEKVKNITIDTISRDREDYLGTAIGDALLYSTTLFKQDSQRKKVMILITDGVSNRGLSPGDAARFAVEQDINIYTIGVGGYDNILIPSLGIEITGTNDEGLNFLAETGSGKYYRADDNKTLENIFNEIESLEKTAGDTEIKTFFTPVYKPFIIILLILLFILFYTQYAYKLRK